MATVQQLGHTTRTDNGACVTTCHPNGIRMRGHIDDGVVICGIAPGRNEANSSGMPFTGPAGQLLDAFLNACGWTRDRCYLTNLICWWNDSPSKEEISLCNERLYKELKYVKPKLIIALGQIVTEHFTGYDIGKARGGLFWNDVYNCWVLPCYHPSAVLHGSHEFVSSIVRDLSKIKYALDYKPEQRKFRYEVLRDTSRVRAFFDTIGPGDVVSCDVEGASVSTDEMDAHEDELLCVGFGTAGRTVVVPAQYLDGVEWPQCRWLFHHSQFDVQAIAKRYNVWLPIAEDTLLQSYSLDERPGFHGLKPLSREYLGVGFYEAEAREKYKNLRELDPRKLWWYNAQDVRYTYWLHGILRTLQEADNVREMYEKILIPTINIATECVYKGFAIDRNVMVRLGVEWSRRYLLEEEALINYIEAIGYPGRINTNSPIQMRKFLYGVLGAPITKLTKKSREASTDKEVLKALSEQNFHPVIDKIIDLRHLGHVISSFILGVQDDVKTDGLIHPYPKVHGSLTGRLAYADPPIMTVPQEYTVGADYARIRRMFIPQSKDHTLVQADYSRMEIYVAAGYSKDEQLFADLAADYHRNVASDVFRTSWNDVTDEQRQKAKRVTFGIMYGVEEGTLSKLIECTPQEAKSIIQRWFARYPVYHAWWLNQQRVAKEQGELVALSGRKRRFHLIYGWEAARQLKQAVNFAIQCTSNDITLLAMQKVHEFFTSKAPRNRVLWTIHDAILFEIHKNDVEGVVPTINDIMTAKYYDEIPPIPVEIKIGDRWSDLVKWEVE
jgi:uracil-DNA glycosylase family 4